MRAVKRRDSNAEKDLEGLVACSCKKGIFKKKYRKKGINKNE